MRHILVLIFIILWPIFSIVVVNMFVSVDEMSAIEAIAWWVVATYIPICGIVFFVMQKHLRNISTVIVQVRASTARLKRVQNREAVVPKYLPSLEL